VLIDVLLVVGDDGLGDGLTDGVDLRGVTTTGDTDTDVDTGELVNADDQEGLVDLEIRKKLYRQKIVLPAFFSSPGAIGVCSSLRIHVFFFLSLAVRKLIERVRTLKRRISGWTRERGWPLTLTRPLPCCKNTQHVVQIQ
jgi:hypothetical protein